MTYKEIPQLNNEQAGLFLKKIKFTNSCWTWESYQKGKGYGDVYINGDDYRAHRVSYELFRKEKIPLNMVLDHLCRNPICVNPFHLEIVTHVENTHRGAGVAAINKNKTHCHRGHPMLNESQYNKHTNNKFGKKWRECKICRSESNRKYKQNRKLRTLV